MVTGTLPRGAGQGQTPAQPTSQPATQPSSAPPITVGSNGRIAGIDGMLDQVAEAMARQAGPMIRRDLLPVLQQDRGLQRTIGAAAGREIAKPLWLLGIATAALAVVSVYRAAMPQRYRSNPRRRRRAR